MIVIEDNTVNRIVFHFNKAHNQDKTISPWIVKHRGQTYYVDHIESLIGFTTKETPDNEATKASIQFRGKLKIEMDLMDDTTTIAYVS